MLRLEVGNIVQPIGPVFDRDGGKISDTALEKVTALTRRRVADSSPLVTVEPVVGLQVSVQRMGARRVRTTATRRILAGAGEPVRSSENYQ